MGLCQLPLKQFQSQSFFSELITFKINNNFFILNLPLILSSKFKKNNINKNFSTTTTSNKFKIKKINPM